MLILRTVNGSLAFLRLCTLTLITFLAHTFQHTILVPWHNSATSSHSMLHLLLFNVALLYLYATFLLACQDPGRVKKEYAPKEDEVVRYCPKCKSFKPPRAHHCKKCRRCVLRMDHHCPWLSSCVGYANHAAFLKFLMVVVPMTFYVSYMTSWDLLYVTTHDTWTLALELITAIVSGCICLMVSCLLVYQVWCAVENITTIESWTQNRTQDAVRRRLIPETTFPYDLYSIRENLQQLFGHGWMLFWWWPTVRSNGSGHVFPVNEDADPHNPWPPIIPERSNKMTGPENVDTTALDVSGTHGDARLQFRVRSPLTKSDLAWNDEDQDYATEEDSDEDYVDGEGENLASYGVDDDDEMHDIQQITIADHAMAQLLTQKHHETRK